MYVEYITIIISIGENLSFFSYELNKFASSLTLEVKKKDFFLKFSDFFFFSKLVTYSTEGNEILLKIAYKFPEKWPMWLQSLVP